MDWVTLLVRKRLHGIDIMTHRHVLLLSSHMQQYAFSLHQQKIIHTSLVPRVNDPLNMFCTQRYVTSVAHPVSK
ncbi:unnamed protein product, partial [Sphenostylis stenocarpa]